MTRPDPSAFLKAVIAFIVAHVIILRGREISLGKVIEDESYAVSVLFSFGLVLLIWILIDRISSYFNIKFDWMDRPGERFILQSLASLAS
jgi:hypothetical protein